MVSVETIGSIFIKALKLVGNKQDMINNFINYIKYKIICNEHFKIQEKAKFVKKLQITTTKNL